MDWRHPSIIAVKGLPFTGKTSVAFDFATILRHCILISLDYILNSVSPPCYSVSNPPPPLESERLINLAFGILCRLVEKQLSLGTSVVIDADLSSRSQLDRLVCLSTSLNATKFVIIELLIGREYAWKRRFEQRNTYRPVHEYRTVFDPAVLWFKPQSWEDVMKLMKSYDRRLAEYIPGVSRLLVNMDEPVSSRHFVHAVQALIYCKDDRHVDYLKWKEHHYFHPDADHEVCKAEKELLNRRPREQVDFCKKGHSITIYKRTGLDYEINCGVCEEPIHLHGAAYTCSSCPLAIHKSCAEMDANKRSFTPLEFPSFVRQSDPPAYSFPENHACLVCRESGQGFSDQCLSCIFESHLKCRLVPTIIEHDCHEHKLHFVANTVVQRGVLLYKCGACGSVDGNPAFYGCNGCNTNYHVECALLPYPLMHKHGGREHPLELKYSRDKVLEDYPCDFCLEMMNPEDWYYHCPQCYITYHLHCAFEDDS